MNKNINIFEQKLEECDYDIQCKYNYIDNQCCECEDEELEIVKEIAELEVELSIAKRLGRMDEVKEIENDIKEDKEYLNYLEDREDILEDLWEEMYFDILKD